MADRSFIVDHAALEQSAVVANSTMNRDRRCVGSNSYSKELGFNPIELLQSRCQLPGDVNPVRWLDLCCGSGRALIEAAQILAQRSPQFDITKLRNSTKNWKRSYPMIMIMMKSRESGDR